MCRKLLIHAGGIGASASLFAAAQPPLGVAWLAPVALVPWLLVVERAPASIGALSGVVFGTLSGAVLATWIQGGLAQLGAPELHAALGVLLVAFAVTGIPWGLIGLAAAVAGRRPPLQRIALFACAVLTVDTARSHLPGALPWLLLGHSQASMPGVAQLAALGGVPLISALLAGCNASVAAWVTARGQRTRSAPVAAAFLGAYTALALFGVPLAERSRPDSEGEATRLLVVQPNVPPSERWAKVAQRTNLTLLARQTGQVLEQSEVRPDLVAWPETVLTTPLETDPVLQSDLEAHVGELGLPVVLGVARASRSGNPAEYRNSVLWMEPGRGVVADFDKTHAVPVVESGVAFPGSRVIESLMGLAARRERVEEAPEDRPLRGPRELAVALCFESIFPGLIEARRTPETLAIVNLANDSWFRDETPSLQQLAFASFRAIEQRLWLVRVAHGGVSAVVDPYGRVTERTPFGARASLLAEVAPSPPPGGAERLALSALLLAGGALGYGLTRTVSRRTLP